MSTDTTALRSEPAPLFELADVSLAFGDNPILDHVDLAISDGGITVIVGPSGAGKSTVLRLLDRLEVPTSGEVRFRGEPLDGLDVLALRRRVGMVFQRPAPFPGTVRDNLLVADPDADDAALAAALRAARLDVAFLDRPADELSGGEAQRMCLARTLVTQPEVLLMDEPTSALDPEATRRLERTARRLADEGHELVWVTHDLEQARRIGDDIVVLIDGRVATGEARERFLTGADRLGTDDDEDDEDDGESGELGDRAGDPDADRAGDPDADRDGSRDRDGEPEKPADG